MIIATFDLSGNWSFSGEPSEDFCVSIRNGQAERIFPTGFSFGWNINVGGREDTHSWPPAGAVLREITPSHVFPFRVSGVPDDVVLLNTWSEHGGVRFDGSTSWIIPRPTQPYPSWEWGSQGWVTPVPYPDDGGRYEWDEDQQAWVEANE